MLCKGHSHFFFLAQLQGLGLSKGRIDSGAAAVGRTAIVLKKITLFLNPKNKYKKTIVPLKFPIYHLFSKNPRRYFYPKTPDTSYHTQPNFIINFFTKLAMLSWPGNHNKNLKNGRSLSKISRTIRRRMIFYPYNPETSYPTHPNSKIASKNNAHFFFKSSIKTGQLS